MGHADDSLLEDLIFILMVIFTLDAMKGNLKGSWTLSSISLDSCISP